MNFISNKEKQLKEMLTAIGVKDVEALFSAIPPDLRLPPPVVDDGMSEYEGICYMQRLAEKNTFPGFDSYLGAGAYQHHVPALVGAICSKSEFLTAYTPYQPEASQGMLQIIFEFQSAICALTGLDVANASVYDGASACAEAVLMALRHHKDRNRILIAEGLNPHYRAVVEQYTKSHQTQLDKIPCQFNLTLNLEVLKEKLGDDVAAILIQSPNFFGTMESVKEISEMAQKHGVLVILCVNPLAYGCCPSAAEQGADIAVGDCQPLGLPLSFGGPYAGYMSCRQELMRQLPGRIAGETVDTQGRRGFVLTLQAREQHIRREKATSNICTNQALAALASLIAILCYGKEGMRKLALTNFQRASYLKEKLSAIPGWKVRNTGATFNEFVVDLDKPIEEVCKRFRDASIEPGLPIGRYFDCMPNSMLIAVTETKNLDQLNRYIAQARNVLPKS